jgi:hypothetical protein
VLVRLEIPFADVRAGDLSLRLGGPAQPALETLELEAAGFAVSLRLLGSSHQAIVNGSAALSETVACLPGGGGPLPARESRRLPQADYAFSARCDRLSPPTFARRAQALVDRAGADPRGLAGVFPGLPGAFTALRVGVDDRGALVWRTWHGYPQSGDLVATESRLERRP